MIVADTALAHQKTSAPAAAVPDTATAIAHEELLRAAMEAAQLGMWYRLTGVDRLLWGGHAADLLAGHGEVTDLHQAAELIHADDRKRFLDTIDAARRSGKPFSLDVRAVRPGGEIRWVAIWGRLIHDEAGAEVRSVGVFRDITDQRLLEHQLTQSHRVEAIGHLAAGIAHEINTPTQYAGDNLRFLAEGFRRLMAFVNEQTDVLERAGIDPAEAERLRRISDAIDLPFLTAEIPRAIQQARDGVRRVGEIVSGVKSFAHPGSGEREATDLNELITATLALSRNEWKYVATMDTDLDPELPPVACLRSEVQQAVLNLVINAAHAVADARPNGTGDERGRITVRTRVVDSDVEISVSDTGPGIPDAIKPRIFDLFFTTKKVGRGTGQGLPLVHDVVVKKHGGSVRFDTVLGCGTTFYLRLPRAWTPSEAS
ncbi:MAG: PAS domain-containing protein [Gemmatimonadales bacterium]|nr:PAS domain-containing protein [Gemmatimonadales bacterium]